MTRGIVVPNHLYHKVDEACAKAGIYPDVWNYHDMLDPDYSGSIEMEVEEHQFSEFNRIVGEIFDSDTIYKNQRFEKRLKECWPQGKMKSTTAPKILYFIHNVAEWICVRALGKMRKKEKYNEWVLTQASKIEFLTRNIIADYRTR